MITLEDVEQSYRSHSLGLYKLNQEHEEVGQSWFVNLSGQGGERSKWEEFAK